MKFDTSNIRQKMVIAGKVVRIVEFVSPFPRNSPRGSHPAPLGDPRGRRNRERRNHICSIRRACQQISDLVHSNYSYHIEQPKFFTLTFAGDAGLDEANAKFHLFVKRVDWYLMKNYNRKLLYIAVPEFQERGAVHYHVVVFNFPYIHGAEAFHKKINSLWSYGFIEGQGIRVSRSLEPVINYMTKYIRTQEPDPRFRYKKRFFCSQGLYQPQVVINSSLKNEVFIRQVQNALRRFSLGVKKTDNKFIGDITTEEFLVDNTLSSNIAREFLESIPEGVVDNLPPGSPFIMKKDEGLSSVNEAWLCESLPSNQ